MAPYLRCFICAAVMVSVTGAAHAAPARLPDVVRLVAKQRIPDGYDTYTLFLICAPGWLRPQFEDRIKDLHEQFNAFGRAIGSEHAAVWFWDKEPKAGSYVDAIDVERSVKYCKQYGLAPSQGPYLVVMNGHPDKDTTSRTGTMQLGLGSKTPSEIAQILEKLTDDLVLRGTATKPSEREDFWRDLQRSFERLQAAVGSMASGLTLGITTPFFSVNVKR